MTTECTLISSDLLAPKGCQWVDDRAIEVIENEYKYYLREVGCVITVTP